MIRAMNHAVVVVAVVMSAAMLCAAETKPRGEKARQAITAQKDSPHTFLVVNTGHVPTVKKPGHPVHDDVDAFIREAVASGASFPFERSLSER